MSLGAIGYVGYAVESVEGTTLAPTKFLPVSSFSFEDTNDYIVPDQIRGDRDRYVAMAAPYATSGSMDLDLIPNDIASLLKSAVAGAVTTSAYAGGGYQHVLVPGNVSPTFTFESSAAGILVMRYGGIRVNTLEIHAAFGEIVTSTWGLEGTSREKQASESVEAYADVMPFHFSGAQVSIEGTPMAIVKDFSFSVGNNLDRIGTLRRTRSWRRTALGMRDTGLSMTLDFTDSVEYDRFLAETFFDVDILLEGELGLAGMGTNVPALRIQIPKVRWNTAGVALSAGDFLEQSAEAMILRAAGEDVFTMTLVNNESVVA
jgi:hypothetical protein